MRRYAERTRDILSAIVASLLLAACGSSDPSSLFAACETWIADGQPHMKVRATLLAPTLRGARVRDLPIGGDLPVEIHGSVWIDAAELECAHRWLAEHPEPPPKPPRILGTPDPTP